MGDVVSIGSRGTCYGCGQRFLLRQLVEWDGKHMCAPCRGFVHGALGAGESALNLAAQLGNRMAKLYVLRVLRTAFEDYEDQVTRGEV